MKKSMAPKKAASEKAEAEPSAGPSGGKKKAAPKTEEKPEEKSKRNSGGGGGTKKPEEKDKEKEKTRPSRKPKEAKFGDKILGTANFNDLEFGVPKYYREVQEAETETDFTADPLLKIEDESAGQQQQPPKVKAKRKSDIPGTHKTKIAPERKGSDPGTGHNHQQHLTLEHSAQHHEHSKSLGEIANEHQRLKSFHRIDINVDNDDKVVIFEEPEIKFHEKEVNDHLKLLERKHRIFLRRHLLNSKRTDILDEEGTKLFQLNDFTTGDEGTPLNYVLYAADGNKQLVIMQGDPGFLGRNGELVARYPGSIPGHKELSFGRVEQETDACSCTPSYTIKNDDGQVIYQLRDANKYCILHPRRQFTHSEYELHKPRGSFPNVFGKIEERKMSAAYSKDFKGMMFLNNPRRNSISQQKRKSTVSENVRGSIGSANSDPYRKKSMGSGKRGSLGGRKESVPQNPEKPVHEHFCIGFQEHLNYKERLLLLVAHLLVNDDFLSQKSCTRLHFIVTILTLVVIFILAGVLVGSVMSIK